MALSKIEPGRRFAGPSKTMTDAHFLMFSAVSGDVHPIHYDVEYARSTPFGEPVAHGLLLAGLMALGASEARGDLGALAMVEQGCRFLKPVKVGDTVRPEFELERVWNEAGREFCRFKTMLKSHSGETLAEGFHVYRILHAEHGTGRGNG